MSNIKCYFTAIFFMLLMPATLLAQPHERSFARSSDDRNLEWIDCPAFMPETCSISVLQGNPEEPGADLFFKLKGNTAVPDHWHHSAERMVLVTGEMEIKYEGEEATMLKPGTYAYGPPEKPHKASCTSDEPCVLFIAFTKPVDAFTVK